MKEYALHDVKLTKHLHGSVEVICKLLLKKRLLHEMKELYLIAQHKSDR